MQGAGALKHLSVRAFIAGDAIKYRIRGLSIGICGNVDIFVD